MVQSAAGTFFKIAIARPACSGIYAGGLSYFMRATALDQKVFDFAVPKFSHAFGLGVAVSLTMSTFLAVCRNLTGTTFTKSAYGNDDMKSNYPKIYEICQGIAPFISAFGATYLLRQMNYAIPYHFTVVCLIPYVLTEVVRSICNDYQ